MIQKVENIIDAIEVFFEVKVRNEYCRNTGEFAVNNAEANLRPYHLLITMVVHTPDVIGALLF